MYLGLSPNVNITGHNYHPVRCLAWKRHPEQELPGDVYRIMEQFGYFGG
jgi:hypothetical protein